jgi:hypothetical protein
VWETTKTMPPHSTPLAATHHSMNCIVCEGLGSGWLVSMPALAIVLEAVRQRVILEVEPRVPHRAMRVLVRPPLARKRFFLPFRCRACVQVVWHGLAWHAELHGMAC